MKGNVYTTVAALFGVVLVLAALYVRFVGGVSPVESLEGTVAVVPKTERPYIESGDADGNGRSDWQDALIAQTNKRAESLPELNTSTALPEDDTLTGTFARAFFEDYVRGDQSGLLTEENQEQFINSSVAELVGEISVPTYSLRDIRVTDDSFASLRNYGNVVAEITFTHSPESEHELVILENAIASESEAGLDALDPIIRGYARILAETKNLATPSGLTREHIALLNAYSAVYADIAGMKETFSDPILSLVHIQQYETSVEGLSNAIQELYAALASQGIVYSEDEYGYYLSTSSH